jgi:DNA (cytosine-5)-methyltransferase 1
VRPPVLRLHDELIVDNFAGGGGASLGIEMALGRSPDVAVNHDPEAIAMHAVNHPDTRHFCESVWDVDPVSVCGGKRVALAWFSPDCTFHSKARGGKPFRDRNRARRRRGLAWVVVRWAKAIRPRVIVMENVEEFQDWGPLLDDGTPCPLRRGFTFRRWLAQLQNVGYQVELREMRACDYGVPTTRKRLFIVARCDGQPIAWPQPTHGAGLAPYRTAAECIDWSLLCPSIFGRKKPLADKTMARIARGIRRYVLDAATPFIVPVTHAGDARIYGVQEPMRTVTAAQRGELALISPTLIQQSWGEREGQAPRSLDIHAPLGTIVAGGIKHALVSAFLAKHYGGHEGTGSAATAPFDTVTARDHHALVAAQLGAGERTAEVRAFLLKYYGVDQNPQLALPIHTVTTRHRFGLVEVHGQGYVISDIGMRMLVPRELFRAQGFPDTYQIDVGPDGEALTKTAQVRMAGNSVCPPLAAAIIAANVSATSSKTEAA